MGSCFKHDALILNDARYSGGDAKRVGLNLNWYLNENMRVLSWAMKELTILDNGITKIMVVCDDIDQFIVRAQWAI